MGGAGYFPGKSFDFDYIGDEDIRRMWLQVRDSTLVL